MENAVKSITKESITQFGKWLFGEERESGTVQKYLRDITAFSEWLDSREIAKETVCEWKERLLEKGYKPVTVNSMLAAVNTYHILPVCGNLRSGKVSAYPAQAFSGGKQKS